jgi:hypothetical protein
MAPALRLLSLTLLPLIGLAAAPAAQALDLVLLTGANQIILTNDQNLNQRTTIKVSGVAAPLIGIDVRPADKALYGVSADGNIYRIMTATGAATWVSKLSAAFDASQGAVVDFNPVADRLRLMGMGGKVNYRINVDNGQVAVDKPVVYGDKDPNKGKAPMVTAGAYINSVAGAKETQLFDIDSTMGAYAIQDPPNDGILNTIGMTGMGNKKIEAIDIFTDAQGNYTAFAVAGNVLHKLDVGKGTITPMGPIASNPMKIIDVAILPPR